MHGSRGVGTDYEALAFDERLGRLVLVGGLLGSRGSLAYDVAAHEWQPLHPAPGTGPKDMVLTDFYQGTYDPVRGTIAMIGRGWSSWELWEYDAPSGVWHHETPAPPPALWPENNVSDALGAMTYDAGRQRLVLLMADGALLERASR